MDFVLLERRDQDCGPNSQWHVCGTGFVGCCSVEPCNPQNPGCPDPVSSSSISSSLSSTSSKSAQVTSTAATTLVPSAALASISSTDITPTTASTASNAGTVSSVRSSSAPVAAQSTTSYTSSNESNVPIIAGAVSTFVAFLTISLLIWFCLRRRKQKKQVRESFESYGLPTKDYVLDRSLDPEDQPPRGSYVFAEFGGRYASPRPALATPAPMARTASDDSMRIDSPTDAPLPDIEKSTLTPPPVHEHPAYHSLSSGSPDIRTYQPGQPIHSPPMAQHPAYHVSRLSQHPAFLSGPSTSSRRDTFPRRTSEVKWKSSPRAGGRSGPMDITPIIPQPPPGRSELEAEVPASYISPTSISNSPPEMSISMQYNPRYYAQYHNSVSTRSGTQASRNSTPVGLGLDSTLSSRTLHNQSQNQIQHHELPTPTPTSGHPPNNTVFSPTSTIVSPLSPFHLETHYQAHLSSTAAKAVSINNFAELREGKEKEVVSPMGEERWSEATCVGTLEMDGLKGVPVSAECSSAGDDYRTWDSWAKR